MSVSENSLAQGNRPSTPESKIQPHRLSRAEMVGLILALIGLVADTISIGTFIIAATHLEDIKVGGHSFGIGLAIILATVEFCCWLSCAWLLTWRTIKYRIKTNPRSVPGIFSWQASKMPVLFGIMSLPATILWSFWVYGDNWIVPCLIAAIAGAISIRYVILHGMPTVYEELNPFIEAIQLNKARIEEEIKRQHEESENKLINSNSFTFRPSPKHYF